MALLSACLVVLAAPPTKPSKLFTVESPEKNDVILPGYDIWVHTERDGGKDGEMYKRNPSISIFFQSATSESDINEFIEYVDYRVLSGHGYFFKVKQEWFNTKKPQEKFRLRLTFRLGSAHGYVDSENFFLKLKDS
ncbi:hypothetical protein BGW38_010882 [Lunasporangiospora selenospora]|uniref:Uncharacterized protein n=1 Tax=Lunasporangiospora selenospora TaxID=979761 RepID=A0A9P6KHQ0_9FUNG|nr:hypothetical protein BGW38_010882 [Lunasporangiospora selenospora]